MESMDNSEKCPINSKTSTLLFLPHRTFLRSWLGTRPVLGAIFYGQTVWVVRTRDESIYARDGSSFVFSSVFIITHKGKRYSRPDNEWWFEMVLTFVSYKRLLKKLLIKYGIFYFEQSKLLQWSRREDGIKKFIQKSRTVTVVYVRVVFP